MFRRRFAVAAALVLAGPLVAVGSTPPAASPQVPPITAGPGPLGAFGGLVEGVTGLLAPPTTVPGGPRTPPARICGDRTILDGPASAPPGAVVVSPGQNLHELTLANPPGTTFWLAPGTHTLALHPYGQVIPKTGNSYIGGPGAVLDGQKVNQYAFTMKAGGVRVAHLTIRNFMAPGNEGVVNHDYAPGWVIERNTVTTNGGAGVMLGDDNRLSYNCLVDNSQYGFQGVGARMTIDHNEVARNNTFNWETLSPGCGCSGGAKFWASGPATITHNWVHDNANVGLFADTNNVGLVFEGNYIADNSNHGLMYETSYNARIVNNTFRRNAIEQGKKFESRGDPFPIGAIYVSESGGDSRVNGGVSSVMEISGNWFEDNWSGVVLWENADRFCASPANTSNGYCTLVDPAANLTTCGPPSSGGRVAEEPYYSDCRWKTQNVVVRDNDFLMDKAAIGCTSDLCGTQGLFANYGTVPSWSPYKGRVVQDAITFGQGNRFEANRYRGSWRFAAYEAIGNPLSFDRWRAAPYHQDQGSTLAS